MTIKIYFILYLHFYFRMFRTGRVNKVFSPRIFKNIWKMITNMKLILNIVPFWHHSAHWTCIIYVLLAIRKIILKWSSVILNTIFYFLMLMNTWQWNTSQIAKDWFPCGPSPFLLFTLFYLSEHFHSHTSLILLVAWILSWSHHYAQLGNALQKYFLLILLW